MSEPGNNSWSLLVRAPRAEVREYTLAPGATTIGRQTEVEVHISDSSASREHARIDFDPNQTCLTITDLNSTNGTFVNGRKISSPENLFHDDKIRIGKHLITAVSHQVRSGNANAQDARRSMVTGDLLLQSVDNYAILLHDISYQLVNIPDMPEALAKISTIIRQMIGAAECQIILKNNIPDMVEKGIPASILDDVTQDVSAAIFTLQAPAVVSDDSGMREMLIVPVEVEGQVAALIWAWKPYNEPGFSEESDLQLVVAVSHQVALTIQRNEFEQQLLRNAYYDQLTSLPNRTLFTDRLTQALTWEKRHDKYLFAVVLIDIDNFKVINDSLGHAAGDRVLQEIADRLNLNTRDHDSITRTNSVARLGGDEFIILLDDIATERDAYLAANRLKSILLQPIRIGENEIYTSVSIGITFNTQGYSQPDEMIRDAEIAMYRAKELGRAQVVLYDSVMHNLLVERLSMETELRRGMEQDEFRLYYQPIVQLADQCVVGLEALLRWHSPARGVLEPVDFFGALTTSGLIHTLDEWVLNYAARDAAKLQKLFPLNPPLYISVNISASLIRNTELLKTIERILAENKISTGALRLEITEKANIEDRRVSQTVFKALQQRGIRISLDDFGTGYSTLSYLLNFPADSLKVDPSFVQLLDSSTESFKIIETLRVLASMLEMSLVAEGIETEKQLQDLVALKCDYGQGFLFSKAVEFDQVVQYITKNLELSHPPGRRLT
jgi:diguanylate cyclase (GGDEF)-like protein